MLKNCNNSELFQFGSCWVLSENIGETILSEKNFKEKEFNKKFKVSFIKSNKKFLEGHRLRQEIPNILKNRNFESLYLENIPIKYPLFEDSMFHIAIENTKEKNYFSEKIIDCFMTKTIPIYWGCPNITDIFDENGIIVFNDINHLNDILNDLKESDYYEKIKYVENNYIISKKYAFFFERINSLLLNIK